MNVHLVTPLDADVFVATWAQVGNSHKENKTVTDTVTLEDVVEVFGAKAAVVESFDVSYYDELSGVQRPVQLAEAEPIHSKSALPSFYMIERANALKKKAEEEAGQRYDIVIRIRPDLLLDGSVDFIRDAQVDDNMIWASDLLIDTNTQVSDKFVFGSSFAMDRYANLFGRLPHYWEQCSGAHSWEEAPVGERLVRRYCKDEGLAVTFFNTPCKIHRW
ncbi:hypothetical protein [Ruegeria sp. B32]|uniref:hypothetical protein n=1 Tax=Ruegeria sp. B32 TaxID=2867020 RepID=UPI0021A5064C|nr:hypothetical protein [Ruegeria sp. B32]UWR06651.1 hypothetical protein K3752_13550 [Ruegeria sp. B32]